ncbi:MAG: 6-pyruvoyl tetrahydropterin synthase family protein [Phycisphaerae bacterium]
MYTVTIEARFSAIHRVRYGDGTVEAAHGHDWRVRVRFERGTLNADGMVVEFHDAQRALAGVLADLNHADLNTHPALAGANPTAEVVARYIFDAIEARCGPGVRMVAVTEAPGCVATYERAGDAGADA